MNTAAVFGVALVAIAQTAPAFDVSAFERARIDTFTAFASAAVPGDIERFAWSADESQFYLESVTLGANRRIDTHRRLVEAGGRPMPIGAEPEWANRYWMQKSHKRGPEGSGLEIDVVSEERTLTAVGAPPMTRAATGGTGVAGHVGIDSETAAAVGLSMRKADVGLLKLGGQVIGEFINRSIAPGHTFGWAPRSAAIAFVDSKGRVHVMDGAGAKVRIEKTDGAIMPAFSHDERRIAWLVKKGKTTHIRIATAASLKLP